MPHSILSESHIHPAVRERIASYRTDILKEAQDAVAANEIVVVGMRQNPHAKKARKLLDDVGPAYKYLEYSSYLGDWRRRLALKMWTGWPTFPMVFVKGVLIGGASGLAKSIESGELSRNASGFHSGPKPKLECDKSQRMGSRTRR
jgi:glutaredoxin-related protein